MEDKYPDLHGSIKGFSTVLELKRILDDYYANIEIRYSSHYKEGFYLKTVEQLALPDEVAIYYEWTKEYGIMMRCETISLSRLIEAIDQLHSILKNANVEHDFEIYNEENELIKKHKHIISSMG